MIKLIALGLVMAATASSSQSCAPSPTDSNGSSSPNPAYECHFEVKGPQDYHGDVAYYVQNYCDDEKKTPQVQALTLWVAVRSGMFDDWKETGTPKAMNGVPEYPAGQTTLVVGATCLPGTEVRLQWRVLGTLASGKDFGPEDGSLGYGDPAPC